MLTHDHFLLHIFCSFFSSLLCLRGLAASSQALWRESGGVCGSARCSRCSNTLSLGTCCRKTLVAPPMASAPSLAHTLTLPDPTTYTPDAPRPHADADPRTSVTRAWGSGGRRQSTGHTHTHTHAHAHTHARAHTHAPSPTHGQHRRLTSVWGGAAEGGDNGGDDDSVEAVSKWIDKRRGQYVFYLLSSCALSCHPDPVYVRVRDST